MLDQKLNVSNTAIRVFSLFQNKVHRLDCRPSFPKHHIPFFLVLASLAPSDWQRKANSSWSGERRDRNVLIRIWQSHPFQYDSEFGPGTREGSNFHRQNKLKEMYNKMAEWRE